MANKANPCITVQKSIGWCEGTPELPGIMRRIYYILKKDIVKWPQLKRVEGGKRAASATYEGNFELAADKKWLYIDILPDKSQLTSDSQGEYPSITQLNKLTAVHPSVGEEASALSAYVNNSDIVYLVQDMADNWRVVGCNRWITKSNVAQDNGQGAAGTTSTTLTVEAPDEVLSPFYHGTIETEDGEIDLGAAA